MQPLLGNINAELNPGDEGQPVSPSRDASPSDEKVIPSPRTSINSLSSEHSLDIEDKKNDDQELEELNWLSRFSKMNRYEKMEFAAEIAFTFYLQTLAGYNSLVDVDFLENNNALLIFLVTAYSMLTSGVMIRSIYNLGPSQYNVLHLSDKVERLALTFSKQTNLHAALDNKIEKKEREIFQRLERENKFLPDFPPSINVSAKETQKSRGLFLSKPKLNRLDYLEMAINAGIGAIVGKNFNLICHIDQTNVEGFIFPLVLGAFNAGINIVIFNRIKNDKLPLPSNMMVQHAREQINSIKNVIQNMDAYYQKVLIAKWKELQITMKTLPKELPSVQEEDEKSIHQEGLSPAATHLQLEGTPQGEEDNDLVTGMPRDYSELKSATQTKAVVTLHFFTLLLPLLISLLAMVIAVQSRSKAKKDETTVEGLLISAGILSILIMIGRAWRYHSENSIDLVAYSNFYADNAETLQKQAEALLTSEDTMNGVIYMGGLFKKDNKVNQYNLQPCIANTLLFQFIHKNYIDLGRTSYNYYYFKVKNKPLPIAMFEDYLKKNNLEASAKNLKQFCHDSPTYKRLLNKLYEDHLKENKQINEKTSLLSFRKKG